MFFFYKFLCVGFRFREIIILIIISESELLIRYKFPQIVFIKNPPNLRKLKYIQIKEIHLK